MRTGDREVEKLKLRGRQTGAEETERKASRGRAERIVPEKEMIDMKCCCRAALAQLERHYGIAVMTHHLACRNSLTGEVAPVQSSVIP